MDGTIRTGGAEQKRAALAGQIARVAYWIGVATPLAIIAGPSPGDIAATLLAVLFLAHSAVSRRWGWLRQPWMMAGLVLWAYLSLRAVVAGTPGTLVTALPFGRFLLFAAGLQNLVLNEEAGRRRLALCGVLALTLLALDGLFQYAFDRDIFGKPRVFDVRLSAFYKHAWVGAIIAWLFLPLGLALIDQKRARLALGLGALWFFVIVASGDRMATLCAFGELLLLGLLNARARIPLLIGLPALALAVFAFLSHAPKIYERQVGSTVSTVENFSHSHYAVIWTSAWKIAQAHPLFGIGPKAFEKECPNPKYGALYPYSPDHPRCATHPHNIYLEWLDDGGLVALFLFVLMMGYIVAALTPLLRASESLVASGLFVTLLARLWPLASWTSFHHAWSAVPFWLVVGWGLALRTSARPGAVSA
jgi:O-antigen ligase